MSVLNDPFDGDRKGGKISSKVGTGGFLLDDSDYKKINNTGKALDIAFDQSYAGIDYLRKGIKEKRHSGGKFRVRYMINGITNSKVFDSFSRADGFRSAIKRRVDRVSQVEKI